MFSPCGQIHCIREWLQNPFIANCRVCCSTAPIRQRNYTQLFNIRALKEDFPGRLSTALDFPVCQSDSQSNVVCSSCIKKLRYLEAFRSLAKQLRVPETSVQRVVPSLPYDRTL